MEQLVGYQPFFRKSNTNSFRAGAIALLTLLLFVRRKLRKPNFREEEVQAQAYASRSVWGTSSTTSKSNTMAQFGPPMAMGASQTGDLHGPGNDAVDRKERLARVRVDMLGNRELRLGNRLGSGLVKGHDRAWGQGKFQKLDEGTCNAS